jgi:predicted branched-subunit amino acid permease
MTPLSCGVVDGEVREPTLADLAAVALAYAAVGVSVSVAVTAIGTPAWLTLAVAVTAYSATGELAFVATVLSGGSLGAAVLSGWLVSMRFGLLTASLGSRFQGSRAERALAAFTAVDPSVALAIAHRDPHLVRRTYWRTTFVLFAGFFLGSVVGVILGNVVGDPRSWGLDAVFPASLLAVIWRFLAWRDAAVAAAVAVVACLLLFSTTPGGVPIIAALVGPLVALRAPARRWRDTDP